MKKIAIACVVLASVLYGAGAAADGWGRGHGRHGHGYSHHGYHGHKSHSSFKLYLGVPLHWSSGWYRPYYSYPRTVVVERQPEVYVQRQVAAAPAQQDYWYYCPDSRTYYPYVQTCPSPWLQVVPQTAPQ